MDQVLLGQPQTLILLRLSMYVSTSTRGLFVCYFEFIFSSNTFCINFGVVWKILCAFVWLYFTCTKFGFDPCKQVIHLSSIVSLVLCNIPGGSDLVLLVVRYTMELISVQTNYVHQNCFFCRAVHCLVQRTISIVDVAGISILVGLCFVLK